MTRIEQHERAIELIENVRWYQKQIARYEAELKTLEPWFGTLFNTEHRLQIAKRCLQFWTWKYNQCLNQIKPMQ